MSADLEAPNGGDPAQVVVGALEGEKKEMTRDYAQLWYQESSDWLTEAAEMRAQLGVEHGREGRAQTGLHAIDQKSFPPEWDDSRGAWVFAYPHIGAIFQEYGAMPHEIRAKKAEFLAFEWPDAPPEVQEQFRHTEGDLVFFKEVNHPGIPAIGFVRYGRTQAIAFLERNGHRGVTF